jgi:excisionase family DNA binding protein
VSVQRAAEYFDVSAEHLNNLIRHGELEALPIGPRARRVRLDDCEEALRAWAEKM